MSISISCRLYCFGAIEYFQILFIDEVSFLLLTLLYTLYSEFLLLIGTDFRNHFPTLMPHIIRILTSSHFHKVRPTKASQEWAAALPSSLPPIIAEALRLNFVSGRSPLGADPVVAGSSPWSSPPATTTIPLASISGPNAPSGAFGVTSTAPLSPAPSLSSTQEPPTLAPSPLSSPISSSHANPAAVDLFVLEESLKLLQQMGPNLDDLLHLVLPHVVQLLDCPTLPLISLRYQMHSLD